MKKCEMDFTSLLAYRLVSLLETLSRIEIWGSYIVIIIIMAGEMGYVTGSRHVSTAISQLLYKYLYYYRK